MYAGYDEFDVPMRWEQIWPTLWQFEKEYSYCGCPPLTLEDGSIHHAGYFRYLKGVYLIFDSPFHLHYVGSTTGRTSGFGLRFYDHVKRYRQKGWKLEYFDFISIDKPLWSKMLEEYLIKQLDPPANQRLRRR